MAHVMVDLETLGVQADAQVATIGAVAFTDGNKCVDTFYVRVDVTSCANLGLKTSQSTIDFWKLQSEEAKREVFEEKDRISIEEAMEQFSKFWKKNNGKYFWCLGANFDEPILSLIYSRLEKEKPWKFWNVRCLRTFLDIYNVRVSDVGKNSHHALEDCKNQIDAYFQCLFSPKRRRLE